MLRRFVITHTQALFAHAHGRARVPLPAARLLAMSSAPGAKAADLDKEIEAITDLATTAKDEMDFAEESRNSVYYNDDKMAAHDAVEEMSAAYNALLMRLSDSDRSTIETRIGMRIKEIQSAYEIMTLNDLED
ncbi:hypothetical protein GGI02_002855 [Coemansia sp. RSA 2322]|uniref:Uncharacterized protein n=1 Tax=Coemansia thaxteri TaxID=2663907 RepID=A0A9W8EHI5_9FUNG|nr:hypothetical protein H4R26_000817 [Coemansia thaxteri]KAJ2470549.1 hypothetical protein GGI02_002855 [Coemansia sp. RSA 2322]